jgi:hypothetical protein
VLVPLAGLAIWIIQRALDEEGNSPGPTPQFIVHPGQPDERPRLDLSTFSPKEKDDLSRGAVAPVFDDPHQPESMGPVGVMKINADVALACRVLGTRDVGFGRIESELNQGRWILFSDVKPRVLAEKPLPTCKA